MHRSPTTSETGQSFLKKSTVKYYVIKLFLERSYPLPFFVRPDALFKCILSLEENVNYELGSPTTTINYKNILYNTSLKNTAKKQIKKLWLSNKL